MNYCGIPIHAVYIHIFHIVPELRVVEVFSTEYQEPIRALDQVGKQTPNRLVTHTERPTCKLLDLTFKARHCLAPVCLSELICPSFPH